MNVGGWTLRAARQDPYYMLAVLADDQVLFRECFALSLSTFFKLDVLEASNAQDALALTLANRPQLVMMDMSMPGMNTLDAIVQIREALPMTKVMILTGQTDVDLLLRSRAIKVHGYALKGDNRETLQFAVRSVLNGGHYIPSSLLSAVLDPERNTKTLLGTLTPKEISCLTYIGKGYSMKEVAQHMMISPKTAETHRHNISRKLGNPTKAQLVSYAIDHGLVDRELLRICA